VKLTPEQKIQKQEILDLTRAKNRALSAWSFKHIKTYGEFLVSLGHNIHVLRAFYHNPLELDAHLLREDIIAFFRAHEVELQQRHAGVYDNFTYEFTPHEYEGIFYDGTDSRKLPINIVDPDRLVVGDTLTVEETLPASAKQTCNLFPFQERAATALLYGITRHNKRGQLLRAAVGTGKTFIIGSISR